MLNEARTSLLLHVLYNNSRGVNMTQASARRPDVKKGASHKKITNFDDLVPALWLVLVLSLLNELSVNFSFYNLPRTTLACYGCSDGVKWRETAERGKKKWLISLQVCHGYSNVRNFSYKLKFTLFGTFPGNQFDARLCAFNSYFTYLSIRNDTRSRSIAQDVQTSVWKKTEKLNHKQTINYKK